MAERTNAEMLLRILNRLPSAAWATRHDPVTMKAEWIYVSPLLAEIHEVPEAAFHEDPLRMLEHLDPADAASLQRLIGRSVETLAPLSWAGRNKHHGGKSRWIEIKAVGEREPDGTILLFGQTTDVTETKRTEQLHRAALDALPAGVVVMAPDGSFPIYNDAAARYAERVPEDHGGDLTRRINVFRTDGVTPFPVAELPIVRALGGEAAPEAELIIRNADPDREYWVQAKGSPIRDRSGVILAGMVIFHDISGLRVLQEELRTRNEQLSVSEADKTALIERLRYSIDELSNPILEIWDDVLAMPIIGVIDARRAADMVQRLLVEVARSQASFVIVDLTGVDVVDTKTADHLIRLIRKVELVGARCVLTGIRPAVSETLVDIGVDFGRITTLRNLKHGLREALRFARRDREGVEQSRRDEER